MSASRESLASFAFLIFFALIAGFVAIASCDTWLGFAKACAWTGVWLLIAHQFPDEDKKP